MILINRDVVLLLVISVCPAVTNVTTSAATTAAPQGNSTTQAPSVDCGSPNDAIITHGSWKNTSGVTTVNSTATLQCNLGYQPNSNQTTITCQNNGNWSSVTTTCAPIDCGSPNDAIITHGSWKNTSGVTTVNSTATLQCNLGYQPNSNQTTITCQNNGSWSSVTTTCVLKDCGRTNDAIITHGSWKNTSGVTTVNSTATLQCNPGYEPNSNQTTITCQNNGNWSSVMTTCILKDLTYNTTCYENNAPQCITQNATCKEVEGDWRCRCNSVFFVYVNTTDRCAPHIPGEVALTFQDVHNTSITLSLNACSNSSYLYTAYISSENYSSPQEFTCLDEKQVSYTTFKNLSPGTLYEFVLVLIVDGVTSHTNKTERHYTRPVTPNFLTLSSIREKNMTLTWGFNITTVGRIDSFHISVSPNISSSISTLNNSTTSYILQTLKGGTEYTVNVFSVIQISSTKTLDSMTPQTATECTHPASPQDGYVSSQENDTILIAYNATEDNIDQYIIIFDKENITSTGPKTGVRVLQITGLQQGTSYTFSVMSLTCNKQSLTPEIINSFTSPGSPMSLTIPKQRETSLTVSWTAPMGGVDNYSVWLTTQGSNGTDGTVSIMKVGNDTTVHEFTGLTPGTDYTVHVQTVWREHTSDEKSLKTFTAPGPPSSNIISNQTATSFNVTWSKPEKGGVDHYRIWLEPHGSNNSVSYNTTVATPHYHFAGLNASTNYTVHVLSVWRGLISVETIKSLNTAPADFTVDISNITETTLNFSINQPLENHMYTFTLIDMRESKSFVRQGQTVEFIDLIPGRLYSLDVIATLGKVNSTVPVVVTVNTRPSRVINITLDENATTNTTMVISWDKPQGDFDNISILFFCTGPNNGLINRSHTLENNTNTIVCSNLDPGTFCTVEFQTMSGYKTGKTVIKNISKSTREEAPTSVSSLNFTKSSRNIIITWGMPMTRNGIIRKYRVIVEDDKTEACNNTNIDDWIECSNCHAENSSVGGQCQTVDGTTVTNNPNNVTTAVFADTMSASSPHLVPGRNYTVIVIPYTKCWGPAKVIHIRTDEEEPKGPPMDINSTATSDTLTITWSPPRCEDITGVITNYVVVIDYNNITCYPDSIPTSKQFNTTSLTFVLNDTQAFNDYAYTISASTFAGQGPPSITTIQRTEAKAPSPVTMLQSTAITDSSVDLVWNASCFPNGKLSNYNISIFSDDTKETIGFTSTDNNTINLPNLMPFRNYTLMVAPLNHENMQGDFVNLNITTRQGVPHKIENLTSLSITGSSITVRWSPPKVYTGVTNYTVKCVDVYFKNNQPDETIWGFNSTELIVGKLRAFWNYSISVVAATVAGTNESHSIIVQTNETEPGPIASLALFPETDVTKPRTVTLVWEEPKLENKNGVITGYAIRYGYNDTVRFQLNLNASINTTVLTNVSTGYIIIEVAAKTSVGEGNVTRNATDVQPGAPLKLNESNGQSLMQPSSHGVSDSERQISIMLPLRSFFCNYTNGKTTRWGLVVAETSRAHGTEPYSGDVAGFNKTLESYRKWKDVKDENIIDPYIPTSFNWNPCIQTNTNLRSRRSVPDVMDTFYVIGHDKECNAPDPSGYCNGQLAPGRSYRVRGFVCTEGGCTESQYSPAINTDPDLTIPIVAGVVSGVTVILVGVIVIILMKRRQTACFAKKTDFKLNEPEATEMTETGTKAHTFKPRFVPLSEFPAHVTDMHKSSNLLFADAFAMVKEKSPALSTSMAELQACRPKNRYTNILSFDHSRVKLLPLEDVEGSDFINANYIPGCKSKRAYIATQGPLPATFNDFWRMIWEQNVGVIVMLTKLVEKGRNKCDMYWPTLGEPVFYGDIVACTKSESTLSEYILRVIELKLKDNVRMVRQFCFLKWPDMGCPDHPYLLLDFVKAVRNEYNAEIEKRGPMVVHCSAGVGRTGTFIAVDNLLQYVKVKDTVDIYNLVLEMRQNRCHMVQTEDQFIYIYECLKEFITVKKEGEVVVEEEPVYENTGDAVYENMGFSSS